MSGLISLGLIVAVVMMWRHINRLETRITLLEREATLARVEREQPVRPAEARPKPATVLRASVPKVKIEAPAAEAGDVIPPSPQASPPLSVPVPERAEPSPKRQIGFEELFGSKLPIWGGGITLAVAGLFIVKYSIDMGLLSPFVRVVLGLLFAAALVAGAEVARRWKETAIDPRVAQALAGAGIAAAYADILMAANVYRLISQLTGFLGLAGVTAGALGLALRFGSPAALLGLVGGMAAPALVGEKTATVAPLLVYLVLVVAGLSVVARRQRWPWLSVAALLGGFGWGAVLLVTQTMAGSNGLTLGFYAILLALAMPLFGRGMEHDRLLRLGAAAIGTVQLGLVVALGGYSLMLWGLYGLLSVAAILLARIDARQMPMPLLALGVGLVTLLCWRHPPARDLAIVAGGMMLIHGGSALFDLWGPRGSWREALRLAAAVGGTIAAARLVAPHAMGAIAWGQCGLSLAAILAGAAALGVRRGLAIGDQRFAILTVTAALLSAFALPLLFIQRWLALLFALLLCLVDELRRRRAQGLDYRGTLLVLAAASLIALMPALGQWAFVTMLTIDGMPAIASDLPWLDDTILMLLLPSALIGFVLWQNRQRLPAAAFAVPAFIGGAGAFILYKQLFRIEGVSDFVAVGFVERVVFNQLLFAGAWAAWREAGRRRFLLPVAATLAALGLVRVIGYDLLIFNPIWRDQLVGQVPLANLLAPAFLFPVGWLWLARDAVPERFRARGLPAIGAMQMLLMLVYAAAAIRQLFHGSLIAVGGVSEGESLAYSVGAVLLALGWLRWGIHRGDRIWRLASLALMLVAVAKVFLVDAAGLDGLLRIASFIGLGLSLIGLGWLYSRHLGADQAVG